MRCSVWARTHFGGDGLQRHRVDVGDFHALERLTGPAIELAGDGIGVDDRAAVGINEEHGDVIVFEEATIARLAFAQQIHAPPAGEALGQKQPEQHGRQRKGDDHQ